VAAAGAVQHLVTTTQAAAPPRAEVAAAISYRWPMAWWRRSRGRSGTRGGGDLSSARAHLAEFASSRRGVEAYVEPATNVTSTTVVLIAHDGEWTRRALPTRPEAFETARGLGVPVYDVNQTGYPARMRAWTARQRREGRS
jgi:hypothetical protein